MALMPNLQREKMPMAMTASLRLVSQSHTLRCDAKQAERRFSEFGRFISSAEHFSLGDFLPKPFVKGCQPNYIETPGPTGVLVISTITIQRLSIQKELCRFITYDDYEALDNARKPKKSDVLLTMDGGTSIGKPALFDFDEDYAIDSHVAILRPVGLDPKLLVYLLASPLGQIQFQRAESGASGQTAVTEEDIRRFRFPLIDEQAICEIVANVDAQRAELAELTATLHDKEKATWGGFYQAIVANSKPL